MVKRYTLYNAGDDTPYNAEMVEFVPGEYILYTDYEALEKKLEEVEANEYRLNEFVVYIMNEWFEYYPEMIKKQDIFDIKEKAKLVVMDKVKETIRGAKS